MWSARCTYAVMALLALLMLSGCQTLMPDTKPDPADMKKGPPPQAAKPTPPPPRPPAVQERALVTDISRHYPVDEQRATQVVRAAGSAAQRTGLQRTLILAVIAVESSFNPMAVSNMGARGLMQVLPGAHPEKIVHIGGVSNLHDVETGIHIGAAILGEYQRTTRNLRVALQRYSGSARNYAEKVLARKKHFDMVESGGHMRMSEAPSEENNDGTLVGFGELEYGWPNKSTRNPPAGNFM